MISQGNWLSHSRGLIITNCHVIINSLFSDQHLPVQNYLVRPKHLENNSFADLIWTAAKFTWWHCATIDSACATCRIDMNLVLYSLGSQWLTVALDGQGRLWSGCTGAVVCWVHKSFCKFSCTLPHLVLLVTVFDFSLMFWVDVISECGLSIFMYV